MHVALVNQAGVAKHVKVGFSWTTFFFGFIPALIRGDLKWAIIMLLLQIVAGSLTFGAGAIVVGIIFAFVYNNIYIKEMLEKGYMAASPQDRMTLELRHIVARMA